MNIPGLNDDQVQQLIKSIQNYFPKAEIYFYNLDKPGAVHVCLKQDQAIDYGKRILLEDSIAVAGFPLPVNFVDWASAQSALQVQIIKSGMKVLDRF